MSISSSGKEYVIDLGSMEQKPLVNAEALGAGASAVVASSSGGGSDSNGARKVRRWTKEENHPPSWDHMPADKDWTVENVERGTADWVRAENAMFAHDGFSSATRELLKVERIQNRTLLKRYRAEREIITSRRGATNLNERYLFHGTSATAPLAIATSADGFVVEAGRGDAFYGKGSYLAEKARYSHHAATPDAATATWMVIGGYKRDSSLTVTASAGGNGIRIAGLAAGHCCANYMGEYTRQAGLEGGKAWYKGGRGGNMAVWYNACQRVWVVGLAGNVGTNAADIFAISTVATPDAVRAGTWSVSESSQPNSAVRCVRA